jgi:hypothetical protein
MPICGTPFFTIATLFFLGIIIGVLVILCQKLRGVSFKKKYGFKDAEMPSLKEINPADGKVIHAERKKTVDGSGALQEFRK